MDEDRRITTGQTTVSTSSTLNNEEFTIEKTSKSYENDSNSVEQSAAGHQRAEQVAPIVDDEEDVTEDIVKEATAGSADLNLTRTMSVHYIEGTKLYALMASLTLIFFLVMLDVSIVSTVRLISLKTRKRRDGINNG
jgi:hypothetical protein